MIISASRRTDVPAFFAREFMDGVRAGFLNVPHPRNPRLVSRVELSPSGVEAIVFWTRDARPLLPVSGSSTTGDTPITSSIRSWTARPS
ncbi:MAG TPA: DUF1848 family protein [Candidatus Aminicenantes bacterium]|nr:DUF1848 family protein [Candidatus Aminicenantes bacterium]